MFLHPGRQNQKERTHKKTSSHWGLSRFLPLLVAVGVGLCCSGPSLAEDNPAKVNTPHFLDFLETPLAISFSSLSQARTPLEKNSDTRGFIERPAQTDTPATPLSRFLPKGTETADASPNSLAYLRPLRYPHSYAEGDLRYEIFQLFKITAKQVFPHWQNKDLSQVRSHRGLLSAQRMLAEHSFKLESLAAASMHEHRPSAASQVIVSFDGKVAYFRLDDEDGPLPTDPGTVSASATNLKLLAQALNFESDDASASDEASSFASELIRNLKTDPDQRGPVTWVEGDLRSIRQRVDFVAPDSSPQRQLDQFAERHQFILQILAFIP